MKTKVELTDENQYVLMRTNYGIKPTTNAIRIFFSISPLINAVYHVASTMNKSKLDAVIFSKEPSTK
jgi:hypothetical protein